MSFIFFTITSALVICKLLDFFPTYWIDKRHFTVVLICILLMTNKITYICFGHMSFQFCELHVVSVIYCCVTTYHKLSNGKLKQSFQGFHRSRIKEQINWVLSFESHQATVRLMARLHFHLAIQLGKNIFQSSPRLLADFIFFDCWTKGRDFFITVIWKTPSASRGYPQLPEVADSSLP